MKYVACIAFLMLGSAANAGGMSDPVVKPVVVAEDAAANSSPSAELVYLLAAIAVFGAAIAN